jgi:hypothetical protein
VDAGADLRVRLLFERKRSGTLAKRYNSYG